MEWGNWPLYWRVTNGCGFPINGNDTGIEPCPRSLDRVQVNIIPNPFDLVTPKSVEEENLIEPVPIPPTPTRVTPSPRDADLTFQSISSNTSHNSQLNVSGLSPLSTDILPPTSTVPQSPTLSPVFPLPAVQFPGRATDCNGN